MKDSGKITITWDDENVRTRFHGDLEHDHPAQIDAVAEIGFLFFSGVLRELPRDMAIRIWEAAKRDVENNILGYGRGA